jgi:hypothetical protein
MIITVPAIRLIHALGAITIVFAASAAWPWILPPVPITRPVAAPPVNKPVLELASLPPLNTYAAIVERPLFSPSRRPPPGVSAAPAEPAIEGRYRLLGVVATGQSKKAFIADGARHIEVVEGDMLGSSTVKQIAADHITLTSPVGETALKLRPAAPEPEKSQ